MQRMLAEVVVPETTTRFIETQITNKSLTNILWNILLSILLGLTGQSDLTHLRLVTQPVSRMLSSGSTWKPRNLTVNTSLCQSTVKFLSKLPSC